MRAVVQRVRRAEVSAAGEVVGRIGATGAGLLVFLGVGEHAVNDGPVTLIIDSRQKDF